jgi:hypothetical protein
MGSLDRAGCPGEPFANSTRPMSKPQANTDVSHWEEGETHGVDAALEIVEETEPQFELE